METSESARCWFQTCLLPRAATNRNWAHAGCLPGLLAPLLLVTALFALWEIVNNLNDILIRQFMKSFAIFRLMGAYSLINIALLAAAVRRTGWAGIWAVFLTSFLCRSCSLLSSPPVCVDWE